MCKRWRNTFQSFYDDMGPKPSPKHSIDRIDNNGNYESIENQSELAHHSGRGLTRRPFGYFADG